MGEYFDIYIIKNTRSKEKIISFVKKFLGEYTEFSSQYEIPQHSENPVKVFSTAEDLMTFCEKNKNIAHAIYFRSKKVNLYAQIFYTTDGYTVFGLSTEDEKKCDILFTEMSDFLNCDFGYTTVEEPAPTNLNDFSNRFCDLLKKDHKYKKLIPDNKFQETVISKIKISEIESDKKLCYALLCWCQDINWPVAKKIVELMCQPGPSIKNCINTILEFNDEDWNLSLNRIY